MTYPPVPPNQQGPLNYQTPGPGAISPARQTAARICIVLGILCLVFTTCMGIGVLGLMAAANQGAAPGVAVGLLAVILGFVALIYVAFGLIYIIGFSKLRQGDRTWPLVLLITASIHEGLAVLSLIGNLIQGLDASKIIGLLILVIFIAAVAQLIFKLIEIRREDAMLR